MASHRLDHSNNSRAWEVILVTALSLCSFSICSCIFLLFLHHSSLFNLGKSRFFLLELRKIDYGLNYSCQKMIIAFDLELQIMIPRLFFAILIVNFCN